MASVAPSAEVALAELASCAPAELSRVSRLREVHAMCSAAGVLQSGTSGSSSAAAHAASAAGPGAADVAKLHALFDAAVAHGMGQMVCHYVDEVCSHDDFSSPDGVEVRSPSPFRGGKRLIADTVTPRKTNRAGETPRQRSAPSTIQSPLPIRNAEGSPLRRTQTISPSALLPSPPPPARAPVN